MYRVVYHDHGIRENRDIIFKNANSEDEALSELFKISKGIVEIHLIQKVQ